MCSLGSKKFYLIVKVQSFRFFVAEHFIQLDAAKIHQCCLNLLECLLEQEFFGEYIW